MGLAYVNFAAKWYCSRRVTSLVMEIFLRFCLIFLEELFGGPEAWKKRGFRGQWKSRGETAKSACVHSERV